MREDVRRHRGAQQGQHERAQRDQQRALEIRPENRVGEDVEVVLGAPFGRQAERRGAQLADGLEAAEKGGEQRQNDKGGGYRERGGTRQTGQSSRATHGFFPFAENDALVRERREDAEDEQNDADRAAVADAQAREAEGTGSSRSSASNWTARHWSAG